MAVNFPRMELKPGYSISRVIKGGWQLAGGHGKINEKDAVNDMRAFVEAGITTFDCADIYTGVEELIGRFLKKNAGSFKSGALPPVQAHTKYVPDLVNLPSLSKAATEAVIDRSLKRLGVESLDLVQFHWWDYSIARYVETAHHLSELQKAGKIRHIGVTNFDAAHLREILDAGVKIIANQVQYSVLDHRPEKKLVDLCREKNISLLCYGALAGGFLKEAYLDAEEPREPLENRSLTKYKLIIDDCGGFGLFRDLLRVLDEIARKHGAGIGEIAVKYIMQKPGAAAVIIGARHAGHLEKIKKLDTFSLDEDDLKKIAVVTGRANGPRGAVYEVERDRDGKHGRIMKYNLSKPEARPKV